MKNARFFAILTNLGIKKPPFGGLFMYYNLLFAKAIRKGLRHQRLFSIGHCGNRHNETARAVAQDENLGSAGVCLLHIVDLCTG